MSDETKVMGWDDEIDPNEVNKPKALLPEGEVMFTVLKVKRDRREMGKLGVCNVADLKLICVAVEGEEMEAEVEDSLPLHPDMLWKSLQFFTAIGQRKHGDTEPFKPAWGKVEDQSGRCVIRHRKFTGRDGTEKTANQVDRYLAEGEEYKPKAAGPTTAKTGKPAKAAKGNLEF